MIPNRDNKLSKVVGVINTRIASINNDQYRKGPSLYFYRRILDLRKQHRCISSFMSCDYCLEILYATLASWDMNTRGAKMKEFDDFCFNLRKALPELTVIEDAIPSFTTENYQTVLQALSNAYDAIHLMKGNAKLVSISKCLHFLFPDVCMPMDKKNTLKKMYGNEGESKLKYRELTEFAYDTISRADDPSRHIDELWNACVMKMVDNAIILM